MTMNPSEKDIASNKEDEADDKKSPKTITPSSSSQSRQWTSSFKNPRIVRVSRTFGGKDRHSKVCTVRGLRDRRIRLSVPTAIQLYDLQDRLGLSQPSKVIDWLINVTKHEIDKLPPLPMIPSNFLHYFHQPPSLLANNNNNLMISPLDQPSHYVYGHSLIDSSQLSAHNFLNKNTQFSVQQDLPHNSSYFQLDNNAPNLSLSQFGGGFSSSSSSQSYTPPFAPYISLENEQFRQMSHLQNSTLHLINSPLKSFSLNASLHSNGDGNGKQNEDGSC